MINEWRIWFCLWWWVEMCLSAISLHTLSIECVWEMWQWSLPSQKDLLFYLAPHLISSYHGNQSARLILHLGSLSSDSFHPPCPNHKSQPFLSALPTQPSCSACLSYSLHFALSLPRFLATSSFVLDFCADLSLAKKQHRYQHHLSLISDQSCFIVYKSGNSSPFLI